MSLSGALFNAISGMNVTQSTINLVAENVANAETQGYTRKSAATENLVSGNRSTGVSISEITRNINDLLQSQMRREISAEGATSIKADLLQRLDQLLGSPGDGNSLDVYYDEFVATIQSLVDTPSSPEARSSVVVQAENIANQLNSLSTQIQSLRQEAEDGLGRAVTDVNQLISDLADINKKISRADLRTQGGQALLDQRDTIITQMSQYADLRVSATETGQARVSLSTGHLLVDGSFSQKLQFDGRSQVSALNSYDTIAANRTVGTVTLIGNGGSSLDLFAGNGIEGGRIGGFQELRDEILVEAQAQLDEIANALALSLSNVDVAGAAVSAGLQDGFDLDVTGLQSGNPVSVTYTQTPPGTETTVTLIRVDDPAVLPLANSATADPNDIVHGIDFSGGLAAAAAAIQTALGPGFTASSPAADTIRILDDGAAATIDISDVSAKRTSIVTVDDGIGLAIFNDGSSGAPYTGSLDTDQKLGFAGRITINPAVTADFSALVVFSTTPPTSGGDATRPTELLERLTTGLSTFSADSGIGSPGAPVSENIGDFARRVISTQSSQAAAAQRAQSSQAGFTQSLEARMQETSGVNVDEEVADLITLQNSFAANARVVSAVQELMQVLLRM